LQDYAFRLTVGIVLLSWAGWQALLISGADHAEGATTHALFFFEAGLALLFYSLFSLLRLKRKEALPARESVQLFFGVTLAALPLLTWLVWSHLSRMLAVRPPYHLANVGSSALLFACILISMAYLVTILVWLQTNVSSYDNARPGSWPHRTMSWLQSSVFRPYGGNR
jgi:hypothetical protein